MPDDTQPNTPEEPVDEAAGEDAQANEPSAAESLAAEALAAAEEAVAGISAEDGETDQAQQAIAAAQQAVAGMGDAPSERARAVPTPAFECASGAGAAPGDIDILSDVNLSVKIELGRTRMYLEDVLRLANGSVVELDKLAGDPVDVYVNDRHVARGEVLILNDNFCVRINEIIAGVGAVAQKAG